MEQDESIKWMKAVQNIAEVIMDKKPTGKFLGYGAICESLPAVFDPMGNIDDSLSLIRKLDSMGYSISLYHKGGLWSVRLSYKEVPKEGEWPWHVHAESNEYFPFTAIVEVADQLIRRRIQKGE